MSKRYGIKYFYDITDRSNFRANPDYKGVCHIAMAQEGHCLPGAPALTITASCVSNCIMRAVSDMLSLSGQVLHAVAALLQHITLPHKLDGCRWCIACEPENRICIHGYAQQNGLRVTARSQRLFSVCTVWEDVPAAL
jgi:hypothetical protein